MDSNVRFARSLTIQKARMHQFAVANWQNLRLDQAAGNE